MSKKRLREIPSADIQLIEIYEDLASLDEHIRIAAAYKLLTLYVLGDEKNTEDVIKVLRRLIRGLCSNRKAARIGFSIALAETIKCATQNTKLKEAGALSTTTLLRLVKEQTVVASGLTKQVSDAFGPPSDDSNDTSLCRGHQEERDHYLGQVFGAEALFRSGVLFQAGHDVQTWAEAVDFVLNVASKKSWLREECGFMLYAIVRDSLLPHDDLQYATVIATRLHTHNLCKTPEGVAIWLALRATYPSALLPSDVWHRGDPLNRKEKRHLCQVMTEASSTKSSHTRVEGRATAYHHCSTVHFAWQVLISQLLSLPSAIPTSNHKLTKRLSFEDFWTACVDEALFPADASQERKYRGFLLVHQCLAQVPLQFLSSVFSQNFLHCLMDRLASDDRYLHRAAEKAHKAILDRAKTDTASSIALLTALLSPPRGDMNFDSRTKTKTIQSLVAQASMADPHACVAVLDQLFARPHETDADQTSFSRRLLADHIVTVLKVSPKEAQTGTNFKAFVRKALALLAKYAYYDLAAAADDGDKDRHVTVSQDSRSMFRSRISSCLSHIISRDPDASDVAYNFVQDMTCLCSGKLLLLADAEIHELIQRAFHILAKLHNRQSQHTIDDSLSKAATLLLSMTTVEVYNEDLDSVATLEDLVNIFGKLTEEKEQKVTAIEDPVLLVGTLLSLVSQPSRPKRMTACQALRKTSTMINKPGLQALLKILETEESLAGLARVFEPQDDNEEAEEDSSDAERSDGVGNESSDFAEDVNDKFGSASSTSNSSIAQHKSDEEDIDEERHAVFSTKVAQALSTRPGQAEHEAGEGSLSDENMDDEQMEEVDRSLEAMFSERKRLAKEKTTKKNEVKDAKERIENFKCRVLELLDIYVKNERANPLSLGIIMPVLLMIRKTSSPLVSRKGCELIDTYASLCKGKGLCNTLDTDAVMNTLREVHSEVGKNSSSAHSRACSKASLLLIRVLLKSDNVDLQDIRLLYDRTEQLASSDPNFKVKANFFKDWVHWYKSVRGS